MLEVVKSFFIETPALLWLCVLGIGIALECIFTNAQQLQSLSGYLLNFRHMTLYLLAVFVFLKPFTSIKDRIYTAISIKPIISIGYFETSGWVGIIFTALIILFVTDFFFYWWHRALHSIGWLWDTHAVHHSDEEMNVMTGVRSHWTVFMFETFTTVLPTMLILGPTPTVVYSIVGILAAWNFIAHSNIKLGFGPLTPVLVGPQLHRIHHSIYRQHHDTNFASLFPIWDVIFGTYYHPKPDEYPPTGIDGVKHESVWQLSSYPIIRWAERIRRACSLISSSAVKSV